MQTARGANNAQSLFGLELFPSDNQIRTMLDPVPPEALDPVYDRAYEALRQEGLLDSFRGVHDSRLIALDGTWYHSSQKIRCPCCSFLEHANGQTTYYHSALTPVLVAPGRPEVISMRPEFITPQDGHNKQDCEIAAAKRWLERNTARYLEGPVTLLGDDLYAHQPFCRRTLLYGFHFLFTCKPDSHTTLYRWVNLLAFLFHTVLGFTDVHYRLIRATLPSRETFFQDLRALTRYLYFPSW
jgi:hypothetical protein